MRTSSEAFARRRIALLARVASEARGPAALLAGRRVTACHLWQLVLPDSIEKPLRRIVRRVRAVERHLEQEGSDAFLWIRLQEGYGSSPQPSCRVEVLIIDVRLAMPTVPTCESQFTHPGVEGALHGVC